MSNKINVFAVILAACILSLVFGGCGNSAAREITFSDLISQAEKYNGKTVSLEASYFGGFEISALCGSLVPSTSGPGRIVPEGPLVWVNGGLTQAVADQLYRQTTTPSGYAEHFGKLKISGKFETGKFGHLDSYLYRITITDAEVLEWSPPPVAIPKAIESNILPEGVSLTQAKSYLVIQEGRIFNEDATRTVGLWYIDAPEADSYEEYAQTCIQAVVDLYSLYGRDFTDVLLMVSPRVFQHYASASYAADGKGAQGMTGSAPANPMYWKVWATGDTPYTPQEQAILALWEKKQMDFPNPSPISSLSYDENALRQYIADTLKIPYAETQVRPLKMVEYRVDREK